MPPPLLHLLHVPSRPSRPWQEVQTPPLLLVLLPRPLATVLLLPPPVLLLLLAGFSLVESRVGALLRATSMSIPAEPPLLPPLLHREHAPGPTSKPRHVLQAPPFLLLLGTPLASTALLSPPMVLPLLPPLSPLPLPPWALLLP